MLFDPKSSAWRHWLVSCLPINRGTTMANDLHLYDVETEAWTTPAVSPRPTGRFAHAACAGAGNSVLIFGGVNPAENVADVVLLTTP